MLTNKTELKIYYGDTDAGGVVYYANYLKYFEIGRTEILKDNGIEYADMEKKGIIAPVVNVNCDYKGSAKYNDDIIIITSIEKLGNSSITFNYKILRKYDEKVLVEGSTVNVLVDIKTKKPIPIPDSMKEKLT